MNMPGFTAETSLYQTSIHYRFAASGSFLSNGNITVAPQGCGWTEGLSCLGLVIGSAVVCGGFCALGPWPGCIACVAALGAGDLCTCYDCLPKFIRDALDLGGLCGGGGGGGGGPPPCCPADRPHCCGICQPRPGGGLICDDACIDPKTHHCP